MLSRSGKPQAEPYTRLANQAEIASFHDDAPLVLELVHDYVTASRRKFGGECGADQQGRLRRLLWHREKVRKDGPDLTPDIQLMMHDDAEAERAERGQNKLTERQWPRYVLSVYVEVLEEIWRKHGGKGEFAAYDKRRKEYNGPLIWLMEEAFEQLGIPKANRPDERTIRPSEHTIYRAWKDAKKRRQRALQQR